MALEPKVVSLNDERNPELEDMTRRFWVCLGPSILVMLSVMVMVHDAFAMLGEASGMEVARLQC